MSYIERLRKGFGAMVLEPRVDYVLAKDSQNHTEDKIKQIIETAGFCPLLSKNRVNGNFVFTVTPYKKPDFFEASHFKREELSDLLNPFFYIDKGEEKNSIDKWTNMNSFRSFVPLALTQGLSEIISPHIKEGHPIVEIGSGIGYTLSENLASVTIRTQPDASECFLLGKSTSDPICQIDIEGLFNQLFKSGKKIPLFFGLNVFDTMLTSERKKCFSQLSKLQIPGDRILILLDTNPYLNAIIPQLETLYPQHALFPFLPLKNEPARFSLIPVPSKFILHKPSLDEFHLMMQKEAFSLSTGHPSELQMQLHELQKKHDLKVIDVETFFAEQIKKELEEAGYHTNVRYHASFATGNLTKAGSQIKQDLLYKPVTDFATVRQWSLDDKKFIHLLNKKGLTLPGHFNEDFLKTVRAQNHKIFGAEFLVIEGIYF